MDSFPFNRHRKNAGHLWARRRLPSLPAKASGHFADFMPVEGIGILKYYFGMPFILERACQAMLTMRLGGRDAPDVARVPKKRQSDIVGVVRWIWFARDSAVRAAQRRAAIQRVACFEETSLPAARVNSRRGVSTRVAGIAKKVSSPHIVFEGIVKGVFVGRYVPGQRLIEADLMRDFSVSRGSVREALNRLAAEGIVSLHPHRGAEVRRLSRKEASDILLLLETLIGLACRLAALNISKGHNKALMRETLASLLQAPYSTGAYEFVHLRNKFYRTLLDIGDNTELTRILPSVQVHLLRTQTRVATAKDEAEHLDDYKVISQAILKADPDASERAGRRHVRRVIGFLEKVEEQAFAV